LILVDRTIVNEPKNIEPSTTAHNVYDKPQTVMLISLNIAGSPISITITALANPTRIVAIREEIMY
jgi:hypothetical protein